MSGRDNPFSAERNPTPESRDRIPYGPPMVFAAWLGAGAQDLGSRFDGYGFIAFLAVVALILFTATALNRR